VSREGAGIQDEAKKAKNLYEISDIGVNFNFGADDCVEALEQTAAVDKERELGQLEIRKNSARATKHEARGTQGAKTAATITSAEGRSPISKSSLENIGCCGFLLCVGRFEF
jgi:hypothetical protein